MDFFEGPVFMNKFASWTVGTDEGLVEGLALLGFVVFAFWFLGMSQFCLTVRKLTFALVSTKSCFNPIFAQFTFVLGLVYFDISLDLLPSFIFSLVVVAFFEFFFFGSRSYGGCLHGSAVLGIKWLAILLSVVSLTVFLALHD